ncbi:MAG: ATPase, T2SS/T4P/T4SS family, partial [archaeon]
IGVSEFKKEQEEFTKNNLPKGLPSEGDYAVPKELGAAAQAGEKSAFEKLLNLSKTPVSEDTKKGTITSSNFSNPPVYPQKKETLTGANAKSVELGEEQRPKIEIPKTTPEKKPTPAKKSQKFEWEDKTQQNTENKKEVIEIPKQVPAEKGSKTVIDEMFEILEKFKQSDTDNLSNTLKIDSTTVEQIAKIFEEDGVLEIEYPASLTKKPILKLKNPVTSKLIETPRGKILQSYKIVVDHVPATIKIILSAGEARPTYAIEIPLIGKYTARFLDFIKDEVAETMPIDLEEILDPKKSKNLKERFFNELSEHLKRYFPTSTIESLNRMSGILLHEMYGLGNIELILGDDLLEEVGINSSKTPITIYHRVHGWLKTNLLPGTEEEINNLASQIGRKVGRDITVLNPILDAHLLSGDRVNATLFPISSEGNTITIRRFARKPWTIIDFIGTAHTMSAEMASMLWLAMQYELNIVIAGGTASGKTSTLNTILALVPTYHRIISIEDVRELVLPKYLEWNWIPMVTRSANPEGLGEVTMLDLMITSLRMRPDRIIVGEMRRKKEAEVLMEAIETGHSIYSTIHANSAYQVLRRLAEPPMSIPLMQIELIDLIVVQYRDRKTNKRRTFEISEIEQTSTGQGLQVNTVYKWAPRSDTWERLNKPSKLITLLNLHTGMTEDEINNEIDRRREIFEWLQRQNITDLDLIGFVVKLFYSEPEEVKKLAQKNATASTIVELMKGYG